MDGSEKISIVRAIVNDPHYWVPAIMIILCGVYMFGRLVIVERQNKQKLEPKASVTTEDSLKKYNEKISPTVDQKKMEAKNDSKSGDTYNVTSNQQSGGITVGKIEKLVVSEEDASGINPYENADIEQQGLTFKLRPKVGKWTSPFLMIPFGEKDSVSIELFPQSGPGFDITLGVEDTLPNGEKWYGIVYGLNGSVPNPATKDFCYLATFSSLPTRFVFGDRSNKHKVAFIWTKN